MKYNGHRVSARKVVKRIQEENDKGVHTRLLLNPWNRHVAHLDFFQDWGKYEEGFSTIEKAVLENLTDTTQDMIASAVDETRTGRFW